MASARRVGLFRREIKESLSPAALEILFSAASRISEGQLTPSAHYEGSTMLSVSLAESASRLQDPCDAATARRLAAHLETDPRVHTLLRRIAGEEARRVAGREVRVSGIDLEVRVEGHTIHLDLDVEGEARSAAASDRSRS